MTTMTAAQIRAQTALMDQVPDPQVPERPRPPRQYPAAYKLRILEEYERLDKAGKGALLRREGLYTSLISEWRKQRDKGALAALQQRRGRPPTDPLVRENARLERENARLRDQLARQAKVLEVQGELSALLSRLAASSATQEPSEPIDPADPTQPRVRAAVDAAITTLSPIVGTAAACGALGQPRSSWYRAQRRSPAPPRPPRRAPRPQPRALAQVERQQVLEVLHAERFWDQAPASVDATLLDEGTYLASISTM